MNFTTFLWVNFVAILGSLLVLAISKQDVILSCTNTSTQRSSMTNGDMFVSEGSIETFGTVMRIQKNSSLELRYPASEPHNITVFKILETAPNTILAQSKSDSKFITLIMKNTSQNWWVQKIEVSLDESNPHETITKAYYCVGAS